MGEDHEKLLEPFDENTRVDRYVKSTKAELIEKERADIAEYAKGRYAKYLADPEKYAAECKNETHIKYVRDEFPKRLSWTDDELYAEAIRFYEPEDIGPEGEVYSTYNPKSKWDWYSVGGRWAGFFKLKPGTRIADRGEQSWMQKMSNQSYPDGHADRVYKGDIDWEGMKADRVAEAEKSWAEYEAQKDGPDAKDPYWHFGVQKDDTKESFIKRKSAISTFAVLKDGNWYEKGEMGWWAIVSNEKEQDRWGEEFEKLIESVPDNTLLTLVDCHI